jgi:hypothetical protein
MNEEKREKFEAWCIIEKFGHGHVAGLVTEATIGGCQFIRCDVPAMGDDHPAYTEFIGNGAIYSMKPVTEEIARKYLEYHQPRPVSIYELKPRQLSFGAVDSYSDDDDDR